MTPLKELKAKAGEGGEMKPISQLITEACNVEEAAKTWCRNDVLFDMDSETAFKAGAAHIASKLGPALEAAIKEAEKFDCGSYVEEAIRAILEGGG